MVILCLDDVDAFWSELICACDRISSEALEYLLAYDFQFGLGLMQMALNRHQLNNAYDPIKYIVQAPLGQAD